MKRFPYRVRVLYICNSEKQFYSALYSALAHWQDGWNETEFWYGDCYSLSYSHI